MPPHSVTLVVVFVVPMALVVVEVDVGVRQAWPLSKYSSAVPVAGGGERNEDDEKSKHPYQRPGDPVRG